MQPLLLPQGLPFSLSGEDKCIYRPECAANLRTKTKQIQFRRASQYSKINGLDMVYGIDIQMCETHCTYKVCKWLIYFYSSICSLLCFVRGLIAELAVRQSGAWRICWAGYLRKKTSRGRHGPLRPSALTLKGITERPLPQHRLHQNLKWTSERVWMKIQTFSILPLTLKYTLVFFYMICH